MRMIDAQYTAAPFYGVRRMRAYLNSQGEEVNHKRVRRLMREMGLEAIYPKPKLSVAGDNIRRYPYLLRERQITAPNQVLTSPISRCPKVTCI